MFLLSAFDRSKTVIAACVEKRRLLIHCLYILQVTLPGEGQSFALIYSIEDPAGNTAQSGVGAQVLVAVSHRLLTTPLCPMLSRPSSPARTETQALPALLAREYALPCGIGNTEVPGFARAQPWQTSDAALALLQVMGPDDSYLLQYGKDVRSFWADPHALALGACFRPRGAARPAAPLGSVVPEVLGTEAPKPG